MPSPANGLSHPFWGVDVASFYPSYAPLIDFVFLALIFVTLGSLVARRQPKRRRLAVVVGLLLAAASAATGAVLGVNIGSLGPVPVAILTLAVGGATYRLLRRMKLRRFGAVCVGLFVAYLCVTLHLPGASGWMTRLVVPPDLLATGVLALGILQGLSGYPRRKTAYHLVPSKARRRWQ